MGESGKKKETKKEKKAEEQLKKNTQLVLIFQNYYKY